jgi:hypothetical protein
MTPQEKNVFGKLFTKTELGTHNIELGSIDVFIQTYKKEAGKLAGIKAKIISASDELGFLLGALETLPKVGNDLIAKMKDLGIDTELQNVQNVNSAIDGLIKSLNPIYKNINSNATKI